jgi:hypothetical protein
VQGSGGGVWDEIRGSQILMVSQKCYIVQFLCQNREANPRNIIIYSSGSLLSSFSNLNNISIFEIHSIKILMAKKKVQVQGARIMRNTVQRSTAVAEGVRSLIYVAMTNDKAQRRN